MTARKGKTPVLWVVFYEESGRRSCEGSFFTRKRAAQFIRQSAQSFDVPTLRYWIVRYAPVVRKGGRRK